MKQGFLFLIFIGIANNTFAQNISVMAKVLDGFDSCDLENIKAKINTRIGDVVTLSIPEKNIDLLNNETNILYWRKANIVTPDLKRAVVDSRADSVHNGIGLEYGYAGKDVIIGITDWGFDYTHPMFYDTALRHTRILAAWDQFKTSGPAPDGYNYGTEFEGESELLTAQSDTSNVYHYGTHGTHVAGIAGGSGAGTEYRGVAYEANFLFATFLVTDATFIDAVAWMKEKADIHKKRLVVNMSWGLYYMGTMDGNSLVSQAIDNLSGQGVTFVTSGGNNGNDNFHIKKVFSNDSIRTRIGFYPYSAHQFMWGQCISMWGQPANPFNSRVEVYNSSNVLVASSRYFNTNSDDGYHDSLIIVGTDTIFYNYSIDSAHPNNNRPHQRMKVKNTNTSLRVVLHSYASSGTVHYWNVVELSNGVGNWGLDFYSFGTDGVAGDNKYGLGEPACTESAITVAAHQAANVAITGVEYPGGLAGFSSIGPTYDGRSKPDVSAPGMAVISSINSYTTRSYTSIANTTFNGRTYHFAAFSGTSMSSPATAGVVALMLEASPTIEPRQIRNILRETAREDNRTGSIPASGSTTWGHGKVTATAAIQQAENTVSLEEDFLETSLITLFPNPNNGTFVLKFEKETKLKSIFITDINGRLIKEIAPENASQYEISFDGASGVYFLNVIGENEQVTMKLIKE